MIFNPKTGKRKRIILWNNSRRAPNRQEASPPLPSLIDINMCEIIPNKLTIAKPARTPEKGRIPQRAKMEKRRGTSRSDDIRESSRWTPRHSLRG